MNETEPKNNEWLERHSQSNYKEVPLNSYELAAYPLDAVFGSSEPPHQIPLYPCESLEKDISASINCDQSRSELDFSWLDDFSAIPHHGQSEEHESQSSPMFVDNDQKWTASFQRDQLDFPQQPTKPQDTSSLQRQENVHEPSLLLVAVPNLLDSNVLRRQYGPTNSHQYEDSSLEQTLTTVSGNRHSLQYPQSFHTSQSYEFLPSSSQQCSHFNSPPGENANPFYQPPLHTYLGHTHSFQHPMAAKSFEGENERDVDEILSLIEDCKCSRGRDCKNSRPLSYGPWSNEIKTWDQANAMLRSTTWMPPQPDITVPQSDAEKLMWAKRLYNAMMDFNHVHDNSDSKRKNYLLQGIYSQREIELACWHAVAVAVELHTRGARLSRAADPTQNSHQGWITDTRKEARRLNFEDRLKQVCWWLRVEKACATNIINGIDISKIIYAPKQIGKSKGDNRCGNEKKKDQISAGKSKATSQGYEECTLRSENNSESLPDPESSQEGNIIGEAAELEQ